MHALGDVNGRLKTLMTSARGGEFGTIVIPTLADGGMREEAWDRPIERRAWVGWH
jgi:hypothetical protein